MMDGARLALFVARGQRDSVRLLSESMSRSPDGVIRQNGLELLIGSSTAIGRLARASAADSELAVLRNSAGLAPHFEMGPARADILFRGRNADGIRYLDALTAGPAWAAASPGDRPYFDVIELYARAGKPERARALLTQWQASDPFATSPDGRSDVAMAQGEIALAEGKVDEALGQFREASVGPDGAPAPCLSCVWFAMARTFDLARQPDSSMNYLERYLAIKPAERGMGFHSSDYKALAAVEKRLGELYDSKNDKAKAIMHYAAFVDQWKDADADLQPSVATVKKRLNELRGQEGK